VARRLRFLLYSQSLTGTGHFVKTHEIARALAPDHDVHFVDGGRPFPRPKSPGSLTFLSIPRIYRRAGRLASLDPGETIDDVMARRGRALLDGVERLRPDVLLIDQFPFFKWDLRDEIFSLIERARAGHRQLKVVCSTWELPRGTGLDPSAPPPRLVLDAFRTHFDGLLIHADPRLVSLADYVPWAREIPVPIEYSGYVSEKLEAAGDPGEHPAGRDGGLVIVSTGGASLPSLLRHSIEAWQHLGAEGATGDRTMVIFLPPFPQHSDLDQLPPLPRDGRIRLEPFSHDFLRWMAAAEVSISQAGYNTCTNVLETRVRAILVPNPATLDQVIRARRMAQLGLARTLDVQDLDSDRLAATILDALAAPRPVHDLDLQGAERTRALLEKMVEGGGSDRERARPGTEP
jgi:predicted glycosyltransferase